MRSLYTHLLVLILVFNCLHAQSDTTQKPSTLERIVDRTLFGGSFGLQFGNTTLLNLSPALAYKLNERVYLGAGITYQYINWVQTPFDAHMYGTRVFPIVDIWKGVFATAEYEWLNYPDLAMLTSIRRNNHAFFLGGGYLQRINKRGSFVQFSLLYNVLFAQSGPGQGAYDSPIAYRISFFF
ncbi:MAG: hypothetical protein FJZ75_05360 [Bacteroidetes bacterium]|nr:hypothetical protein [Bacteroidota bacterium]